MVGLTLILNQGQFSSCMMEHTVLLTKAVEAVAATNSCLLESALHKR